MTEQAGRDAAVAVITEAFNTAHRPTPDAPELEEDERLAVYEQEREELAAGIVKAVQGQYIGKPPPLLTGWQERAVSAVLAAGWLPPAAVQERVDAAAAEVGLLNDQPLTELNFGEWPLSDAQIAELEARFREAQKAGEVTVLPPRPGVTPEQVEQAALFLFAVRTYSHRRLDYARKCWDLTIDEDDREAWRRTARDLLTFAGITVQDGEQE